MSRFDEFWEAWPSGTGRKKNRVGCEKKWAAKKLDDKADMIIADVEWRKAHHKPWMDGYVPMPATYLNQESWTDERLDASDKRAKGRGPISRLSVPEVRLGAIGLMLKGYRREVICKCFGLSDGEYDELERDETVYERPPLKPGDEWFV